MKENKKERMADREKERDIQTERQEERHLFGLRNKDDTTERVEDNERE